MMYGFTVLSHRLCDVVRIRAYSCLPGRNYVKAGPFVFKLSLAAQDSLLSFADLRQVANRNSPCR
jgi:hypothetical protein